MGIFKKSDPVGSEKTITRKSRRLTFKKTGGHGKNKNLTVKIVKNEPATKKRSRKSGKVRGVAKGKQLNKKRSLHAKRADKSKRAKNTVGPTAANIKKWKREKNTMDLKGVDTP